MLGLVVVVAAAAAEEEEGAAAVFEVPVLSAVEPNAMAVQHKPEQT